MDIRNLLIENDEDLFEFTQTIQYELSREIMKLRYDASFTEVEMAKALDISFNEYIALESGDTTITEEDYLKTIISVQLIVIDHLKKSIEEKVNKYADFKLSQDKYSDYYNYKNSKNKIKGFELNTNKSTFILLGAA